MLNFIRKNVSNLLSSFTFINRNKRLLGWISIGGLSIYTYVLYSRYYNSGSALYMIDYQPSYSGILYSINYLQNIYNRSLKFLRVQKLIDYKYERSVHLLDVTKYKDLYFNKLLAMKSYNHKKECNLYTHKNILFEATPRGNVIVFFNTDDKQFHYYSDYSIPYDIIDSVLQKYVVTFHCTELYNTSRCDNDTLQLEENNNRQEENEDNENNENNKNKNTTTTPQQKTKDKYRNVYAKLKKNKTNKLTTNADVNEDINKYTNKRYTQHGKNTKRKTDNGKASDDIEELIIYHKMKHCGKLRDFDFKHFQTNMNQKEIKASQTNNNLEKEKSISYKDFKM